MTFELIRNELQKMSEIKGSIIHVSNAEWYSLFKEEIRNSIAIEGIFANRQDLIDVLEHNSRTNKHKAASILGYFESASTIYEYAANQYKEKEFVLRMSDIKQIHTLLMRYEKDMGFYIGDVGEFRKTRAEVTQSTFTPISEFYVRDIMECFIKWINRQFKKKTYDPIFLASVAHVWFESIHPFRDGNGRCGRILLSYILIGCGLINIAIKGISKKDRNEYYLALEEADDCFELLHRKIENGYKIRLLEIDQLIYNNNFNHLVDIVKERLKDSVIRLQKFDLGNIDKQAQMPLRNLANIYNYSQDYLRNLINRGKLKGIKKGKTWYVRVKDLSDYAKKGAKS